METAACLSVKEAVTRPWLAPEPAPEIVVEKNSGQRKACLLYTSLSDSDVGYDAQIMLLCNSIEDKTDATACPDMKAWKAMLIQEKFDAVCEAVADYLSRLARCNRMHVQWLNMFRDEFLQMICEVLQTIGISAAEILSEPLAGEEFDRAAANVQVMIGWTTQVLNNISEFVATEKADTCLLYTSRCV